MLAGTYDASTNLLDSVTADGSAAGFTNGQALPAAATGNNRHYVVVSQSGTGSSPAPTVSLEPPDIILSNGSSYILIETSETITAQIASNVGFTPTGNLASVNVQSAIAEVDSEKVAKGGDTMTGDLTLNNADVVFEGATENAFETTLTVTDPTADNSIVLPDISGTVVTTGDTGSVTSTMITDGTIVNADINASAEIAVSKLANGTARQLLQTDAAGTGVEFTSNVDVPGTFDVAGAGTFDTTLTVTGVISADGKVKFPAGTAAAPSFYSGTDTDTGLYFSAADEVSVATGGTQRLVVDTSGQVGIGTSSVNANLQVHNSSANATLAINNGTVGSALTDGLTLISATDGSAFIAQRENADLIISTNNTERMRVDSSGRLLVGTTSARGRYTLQLEGNSESSTDVGEIWMGRPLVDASINSGTGLGKVYFGGQSGGVGAKIEGLADAQWGTNDYPGRLTFSTTADGASSPTERMRIDSSGNVGINSTSPEDPLHIKSNSGAIRLENTVVSNNDSTIAYDNTDLAFHVDPNNVRGSSNITFSSDGNERMRLDSSGRLLVGRSSIPTSADASNSKLTLSDASGANLIIARDDITIDSGDYLGGIEWHGNDNGDSYWNEVASIFAAADAQHFSTQTPTRLVFNTCGTDLTNTERMRIDSSGSIQMGVVGATSNVSSELKVVKSAASSDVSAAIINQVNSDLSATVKIKAGQYTRNGGEIVFGRENASSWATTANCDGYIAFAPVLNNTNTERMRIKSNGGFRVSTNSADSDYYTGSDAYHLVHLSTDGLAALIVEHSGNSTPNGIAIDLSDASPDNNSQYFLRCLDISGNRLYIWSDGDIDNHDNSYGAISDIKLKQDIVDAGSQWDDLKDLRVRKFKFKSDVADYGDEAKTLIGLVAQEVETVSPGLVKDSPDVDDDGNDLGTVTKSIRYSVLYMKAVKALQEAMERIETLESKVAALEAG